MAFGRASGVSWADYDIASTLGSGVLAAVGPNRDEGKDHLILPEPVLKSIKERICAGTEE